MNSVSLGDMTQFFQTRRDTTQAKLQLQKLTSELATGQVSDVGRHLRGDTSRFLQLDQQITLIQSYKTAIDDVAFSTDALQSVLDATRVTAGDVGASLLAVAGTLNANSTASAAEDARRALETVIGNLSSTAGGQAVLGGTAVDRAPFASADAILGSVVASVAGALTEADVVTAVDAWFQPGGTFETLAYTGSTDPRTFLVDPSRPALVMGVTGDATEIRDVLKGLVLAALPTEGVLSGQQNELNELSRTAAETLLEATDGLTYLQDRVGRLQEAVENAGIQNQAHLATLELAKSELVAVDPYETATRLEETQTQIEMIFAMTARLSQLSMVNYLR